MRCVCFSALVLASVAAAAAGQSATFLVPESAEIGLASPVRLSAVRGAEVDAAPEPWPAARIAHFFARTAWTQENRDALPPDEGSDATVTWPADRPGVLLLGVDLAPEVESIDAASFAAFMERSLGERARDALGALPAQGEVAVLHTESAKAVVRVRAGGATPTSIAASKTGQAVELRPLMDPTILIPGSDLVVKVYARLPGSSGGVITATNTTTGEVARVTTNDESIANIRVGHAGRWRLEFHAAARLEGGDAPAAWELHTATLTFDVPEEVAK